MFDFLWPENLSIFLDNLCFYHVCFDLISFITLIFTWWFCKSSDVVDTHERTEDLAISDSSKSAIHLTCSTVVNSKVTSDGESNSTTAAAVEGFSHSKEESYETLKWTDDNIVSNLKIMRQKALVKELQSKLTEDELEEEKKTERKQLEKIFQLLQDQEDKFQMTSMEQVEDQLHLYRI